MGALRLGDGGRRAGQRSRVADAAVLRAGEPRDGLPAGDRGGRDALRSGPVAAVVGAERRRPRLPVRPAGLHVRGQRCSLPLSLRGHAGGRARHQQPRSAHPHAGRRGQPARATDGIALRDEPRAGQRARRGAAVGDRGPAHQRGVPQPGGRAPARRRWQPRRVERRPVQARRERSRRRPLGARAPPAGRSRHRDAPRSLGALLAIAGAARAGRCPRRPSARRPRLRCARPAPSARDLPQDAQVRIETERLRSSLLSSVSHDLRTPLATITGAASTILESGSRLDAQARQELLESVREEAERLNRLVQNLLEMTRLESGALQLHREWHPLEEVIGAALSRLGKKLSGRKVHTSVPSDLPLVPIDDVLIEQVLVN
ncbi:MAG: hypothetical protein DME05_25700, partial [Candidatus Rokuibacteriota bacterium]